MAEKCPLLIFFDSFLNFCKANKNCEYFANLQNFCKFFSTWGLIMWVSHFRLKMTNLWPKYVVQAFLPPPWIGLSKDSTFNELHWAYLHLRIVSFMLSPNHTHP